MMQLAAFDARDGLLLADWSGVARDVECSTNAHGFASLSAFVPMTPARAFYWFDRPGLPWLVLTANGVTVWEGRVEDVRLESGGVSLAALGAWSAFGDAPFTQSYTGAPTTANVIVTAMLTAAAAVNGHLSTLTDAIDAPGLSLVGETFTNADMRDELTRLADLGDNQTPPRRWEIAVWERGKVVFRPRGSGGQDWYVDAADLDIERSLGDLWNEVKVVYNNGASTTAAADDDRSIDRYGLRRIAVRTSRTTDATQAAAERDAYLDDKSDPTPRASVRVTTVYSAAGGRAPLWMVRSGDTLTIRNLPPSAGTSIDRLRSFVIAETRYRCDDDTLEITPESPPPRLDVLLAQMEDRIS